MLTITWLGHSTIQLELATGETILIDPWLEGNPKYPAGHTLTRCDAILISHGHGDHLGNTVELAQRFPAAKIVCIYELACYLGTKGVAGAIGMNKGGTVDLGFARVAMTHALHSSSSEDTERVYCGEPAGFAIDAGGHKLYFAGDTAVFGDMRILAEIYGPFDVALLPIGDLYTMGPREAAYATRLLRPKQVLPIHWERSAAHRHARRAGGVDSRSTRHQRRSPRPRRPTAPGLSRLPTRQCRFHHAGLPAAVVAALLASKTKQWQCDIVNFVERRRVNPKTWML